MKTIENSILKPVKSLRTLIMLLALIPLNVMGQVEPEEVVIKNLPKQSLRSISHNAFQAGEVLKYRLHYGFIDAGEATVSVSATDKKVRGREMLHVKGIGKTLSGFNWMFKVDDRYESYIDKEGVFPWVFVRRVREGNYSKDQDYTFYQHKRAVDNKEGKEYATPESVQDMISAFYYARTFDFSDAKPGDIFSMDTFVDDEIYTLSIKFVKRETVKLRNGKYKSLKFVPVVQKGRIFKSSEDLEVWISDDDNKIPLMAKAKVLVGNIKMELKDYDGLVSPISKIEK